MREPIRSVADVYAEAIEYTMMNADGLSQKAADRMCCKKLVELLGIETLKLANRHGNIKPREVIKYFGVEDAQTCNNP